VRDLTALSTLAATWKASHPQQILDSLASALASMLGADLVYACVPGLEEGRMVESQFGRPALKTQAWCRRLAEAGENATVTLWDPENAIRVIASPIVLSGPGVVAAGSQRSDFPSERERLLVHFAAREVTTELRRWRLETERRRFLALVERSADFISLATLDGRPFYVNPAGLMLIGLSPDTLRGLHVLDFLAYEQRERAREEILPVVMRSGRWTGELLFRHFGDGTAVPMRVDWFRIDDIRTNRPLNLATVSRDLTEERQSEAQLRRLAGTLEERVVRRTKALHETNRKLVEEMEQRHRADSRLREIQDELHRASRLSAAGELAAALAHELNQPLAASANSINAARMLLRDRKLLDDRDLVEVLEEAEEQILRAGQIVQRLRRLMSRGESDKRVEHLPTLIEEACALALTGSDGIQFDTQLARQPEASHVWVDRIQVQQVLVNLIRNAVEAMAGSKRRLLRVTTELVEGDSVEVAVADTGHGIPKEVAGRLFEPFVSTKQYGMGIGLGICRSVVEAHGGRLRNEPNPGGGTIFRFTLPIAADRRGS
jgi:PAS domain S-box-containing protein